MNNNYLDNEGLIQPLGDDVSSGEVGPLDAEAAVLQRLWQRVLEGDLCSQLTVLLRFTQDLQSKATSMLVHEHLTVSATQSCLGRALFIQGIGVGVTVTVLWRACMVCRVPTPS